MTELNWTDAINKLNNKIICHITVLKQSPKFSQTCFLQLIILVLFSKNLSGVLGVNSSTWKYFSGESLFLPGILPKSFPNKFRVLISPGSSIISNNKQDDFYFHILFILGHRRVWVYFINWFYKVCQKSYIYKGIITLSTYLESSIRI